MNSKAVITQIAVCAVLFLAGGFAYGAGAYGKPNMIFGSVTAKERLLRKQKGPSEAERERERKQRESDRKLAADVKRLELQQKRDALLRQKQMQQQADTVVQNTFRKDGYMSIPWGASIAAVSSMYDIRENIWETILTIGIRIRVFVEKNPAPPLRGRVFYFMQEGGVSKLFRVDVTGLRESNDNCLKFIDGHKKLYGEFSSVDLVKDGISYTKFRRDEIAETDVNIFKIKGEKSSLTVIYDNPASSRVVVECLEKLQKTKAVSAVSAADGSKPKDYSAEIIWYGKNFNSGIEKVRDRILEIID